MINVAAMVVNEMNNWRLGSVYQSFSFSEYENYINTRKLDLQGKYTRKS